MGDLAKVLKEREDFANLRSTIESIRSQDEIGAAGIPTWDRRKLDRIREDLMLWFGRVYAIGWEDGVFEASHRDLLKPSPE
jgi:hypothetical protein